MGAQYFSNVVGFLDTQVLEERFFKDPVFLMEILERYQKTCHDCLADLRSAAEKQLALEFANAAHKLKGSTLNFSKFYIANWLEEMERNARNENRIPVSQDDLDHLESLLAEMITQLENLGQRWKQEEINAAQK